MKIKQILGGALAMLALLVCAACAAEQDELLPLEVEQGEGHLLTLEHPGGYRAEISLAQLLFTGGGAATINDSLAELQRGLLAQYQAEAELLLDQAALEEREPEPLFYTHDESLRVLCNDGRYLSLLVEVYDDVRWSVHPLRGCYGLTFDAQTGERLRLEDFWGADARADVAAYIYDWLVEGGREHDYFDDLAENLLAGWQADGWATDGETLYIYYNPYAITSYAMGIQVFELPLTRL